MHGDIGVKADVSNALGGNPKIDASACLNLGDAQVRAFGHLVIYLVIWLFGHLVPEPNKLPNHRQTNCQTNRQTNCQTLTAYPYIHHP